MSAHGVNIDEQTIVDRLRQSAKAAPTGSLFEKRFLEAADEIERLRSLVGKANTGPSFAEITRDLRHSGEKECG
jgi:phage tail tape-measure protein